MPRRTKAPKESASAQEGTKSQDAEKLQSELEGLGDQAVYELISKMYEDRPLLLQNQKQFDPRKYIDANKLQKEIYDLHQKAGVEGWDNEKVYEEFQKKVDYLFESGEGFNDRGKKVFGKDKTLEQKASGGWWPISLGRKREYKESASEIDEALNREGPAMYELSQMVLSNPTYIRRHPELAQRLLKTADDLSVHYGAIAMMEHEGIISSRKAKELKGKIYGDMGKAKEYLAEHTERAVMGERAAAAILGVLGIGALAVNASKISSIGTAAVTGSAGNFTVTSIVGIGLLVGALGLLLASFRKK